VRTLGFITLVLLIGIAVFAIVVGISSIPDIRRYLRIRSM
jgi:hypothetical protein